jgi:hypothetical protein
MARKTQSRTDDGTVERTVTRTVERMDDDVNGGPEEASVQEMEAYENIERIRSELGDSEGYVLLARRLANGQLATLAKINASIFDVDYIIKKYGGGVYSARFFKSGVAIHAGGFLGSVPFNIDPSVQPEPEPAPVARGSSGGDAPTWLAAVLDKMGDAIKTMAERKPEPPPTPPAPPDAMAMIEKLATTMRALTPPPLPVPPPPPPPTSLKDQLEMIKSVVEVGTTIIDARGEGGGGSGDAYMGVVSKLAEPVIELVKAQAGREQLLRGPRRVALPPARATGPVPDQPAAPPAPAGGAPQMPWLFELQRWLPLIQKRAQKGLSAESTAFFVLDELSETTLAALAEIAAQEGFEVQVQQLLPAGMQPEWVGEFLVAVKDYLFADGNDGPETAPQGDDVIDLQAEAERRLDNLKGKGPEQESEQGPAQEP